jgi:hypothetical protein
MDGVLVSFMDMRNSCAKIIIQQSETGVREQRR